MKETMKIQDRFYPSVKLLLAAMVLLLTVLAGEAQNILPTPQSIEKLAHEFEFGRKISISAPDAAMPSALYLQKKLATYLPVSINKKASATFELVIDESLQDLGREGYQLEVNPKNIRFLATGDAGLFYGIQSFLQLLPAEVQAGHKFDLKNYKIQGLKISDRPKYPWRSFMLDSGRQYQKPAFIKRYLEHMAMLKMNVFHWHLTEGQGWRIEIKKYPKLTEIGSNVADGKEQQGYYTQEEIKDIVAFAEKLHITVVPEIDIPGHSEAALTAYPEFTCEHKAPETVMGFSDVLFCAGNENTYSFLEDVLDEVCELFPSPYIHLGGDEAPKGKWNKCPLCQAKIKNEQLTNSHELQAYFSTRFANYLKTKNKKVIFWGDVIYNDDKKLPDNVVIHWWNWRGHTDVALKNAIKNGHKVIANTNYYSYLNFPLTAWSKYNEDRTFDMKTAYEKNPSDLAKPDPLVLGMGAALWTDWWVREDMIDQRVFPRIYALAEQMWNSGERLPFDQFYGEVKQKYPVLREMGIDLGPAMKEEMPAGYSWE